MADEPTSALDAERRADFLHLLMRESSGAGSSLLFVSHDLSLADFFERRVRLAEINRADASRANTGTVQQGETA